MATISDEEGSEALQQMKDLVDEQVELCKSLQANQKACSKPIAFLFMQWVLQKSNALDKDGEFYGSITTLDEIHVLYELSLETYGYDFTKDIYKNPQATKVMNKLDSLQEETSDMWDYITGVNLSLSYQIAFGSLQECLNFFSNAQRKVDSDSTTKNIS